MWKNKKSLLVLILATLLCSALVYGGYVKYQKSMQSTSNLEEWTTYEVSPHNFSFDYPKKSIVNVQQDTSERFLRIQNYDTQDISRSMSDRYWVEFFAFTKDNDSSSCPRNIVDYDIVDLGGVTMHKGITQPDEGSGAGGGLQAVCIDRGDYDIYAQGQDGTAENIFEQIVKSIRFTE